jgi:hypothetical protein
MPAERGRANDAERALDRRNLLTESVLELAGALIAGGGLMWAVLSPARTVTPPTSMPVVATRVVTMSATLK